MSVCVHFFSPSLFSLSFLLSASFCSVFFFFADSKRGGGNLAGFRNCSVMPGSSSFSRFVSPMMILFHLTVGFARTNESDVQINICAFLV